MMKMRYVGGAPATIGYMSERPIPLKSYGQLVELTEEQAQSALDGRVSLLTPEEFDGLGHPPEEVKKYARFESHANATQDFLDRRNKAWVKVQTNYQNMKQASVESTPVSAPEVKNA